MTGPATLAHLPAGVHRLGDARVNFWLVAEGAHFTLIDAGLPRHWPHLYTTLTTLGRSVRDIAAIVITHAHPDHLGLATRVHDASGATAWIHPSDAELAAAPLQTRRFSRPERSLLPYLIRHPAGLSGPLHMLRMGAVATRPITRTSSLTDGGQLDVPGRLTPVHVPGHTPGSTAYLLPDGTAAFTGDALVTHDAITGHSGPCVICPGITHNSAAAMQSLTRLATLDAATVLPGHGEPWPGTLATAARAALDHGIQPSALRR